MSLQMIISRYEEEDIVSAAEYLGYTVTDDIPAYLEALPKYKLKDILCDMCGVNHHTPEDELLNLIRERI